MLAHVRCGHLNQADLRTAGLIGPGQSIDFCYTCALGKSRRQPVAKHADRLAPYAGAISHADIAGPFEVATPTGQRYALNVVDEHTRYTSVFLMTTKDQALTKFQDYAAWLRAHAGISLRPGDILQTDSDSCFRDSAFDSWFAEHGIVRRCSPPYTQAKNSIAERSWLSLTNTARTQLLGADLPTHLWGLSLLHAAHVRNLCPSAPLDGDSPHYRLFGKDPDLSQLRVFGAPAFVNIDKDRRRKLDPTARPGIYVGYDGSSAAHLIYFSDSRRVVSSYHVVFDEMAVVRTATRLGPLTRAIEGTAAPATVPYNAPPLLPHPFPDLGIASAPSQPVTLELLPAAPAPTSAPTPDAAPLALPASPSTTAPVGHVLPAPPQPRYALRDLSTAPRVAGSTTVSPLHDHSDDDMADDPPADLTTTAYSAASITSPDPGSFAAAMASPHAAQWRSAIEQECDTLVSAGTFTFLHRSDLPADARPLSSIFVFRTKRAPTGAVLRYKARLVARGCSQRLGIDVQEDQIFAPVTTLDGLRLLLAHAAANGYHTAHLDITAAFVRASLAGEQQYIRLPPGFPPHLLDGQPATEVVARLERSLYGLRQAGRRWYDELNAFFTQQGFVTGIYDTCLYRRAMPDGSLLVALVWVDDIILTAATPRYLEDFKRALGAKFPISDRSPLRSCLGLNIHITKHCIRLEQQHFCNDLLQQYGLADCKPSSTPSVLGSEPTWSADPAADPPLDPTRVTTYRQLVGSLLYISSCTRPDLTATVHRLTRRMQHPTEGDLGRAKHTLRYLRGTAALGLVFRRPLHPQHQDVIVGYADASWASTPATSKSLSAYVFMVNGAAVAWRTRSQSIVAMSTTEAEADALASATRQALFLRGLAEELGLPQHGPTLLHQDNQATMSLVVNPMVSSRTKHTALRVHFTREQLKLGHIRLQFCSSSDMLADLLTKALPSPQHQRLRTLIMGLED